MLVQLNLCLASLWRALALQVALNVALQDAKYRSWTERLEQLLDLYYQVLGATATESSQLPD